MKKLLRFLLICTLTIGLSACESNASNPQTTGNADADYLGKYLCTGITLDGLTMNPNGKWLELNADGTVTTFLTEEADEAEWKLEGENFTMTLAGKMVGTGTLQGNELSLEMMGMEYTFVQEGTGQDGQEASSSSGSFATFTCYGNLYAVRYPTDLFQQDPAGLSDLYTEDGVKGWITKLDTEERVTEWLAGFDEKETNENVQDYQTMEYTVAGYPARAIVYQDAEGWHSEVIVNFGKDMGNETYSMYAAYIYFTGDTYVSVWNEEIQGMINSLSIDG